MKKFLRVASACIIIEIWPPQTLYIRYKILLRPPHHGSCGKRKEGSLHIWHFSGVCDAPFKICKASANKKLSIRSGGVARHSAPMDGVITSDNKILRITQNILRPRHGMGIKNPPASAAGRGRNGHRKQDA